MKKIIALLMALCLVCLCGAALAEVKTADGNPLVLDGFTLNVDAGAAYQLNDKAAEQVYVTVYPYLSSGDQATNFNAVWTGTTGSITVEEVRAEVPGLKEEMAKGFESYGFTLDSIEYADPVDNTLGGESCVSLDSQMKLSMNDQSLNIIQRQYYVGSKGYIFTISAGDAETLEGAATRLNAILSWN
jgi:hypothetical protein